MTQSIRERDKEHSYMYTKQHLTCTCISKISLKGNEQKSTLHKREIFWSKEKANTEYQRQTYRTAFDDRGRAGGMKG